MEAKDYVPQSKNYHPGSISFAAGFMGSPNPNGDQMVADYPKAKAILEYLLKQGKNIERAVMGLDGDFDINSSTIYRDGEHSEYDAWDNSNWAIPIMIVEYSDAPSEMYHVFTIEK